MLALAPGCPDLGYEVDSPQYQLVGSCPGDCRAVKTVAVRADLWVEFRTNGSETN